MDNRPAKRCNKVDLPAPFRPTNATRALRGNTYDTSCNGKDCPSCVYDTCSICNTADDAQVEVDDDVDENSDVVVVVVGSAAEG